jgi:hypothetical protein
MSWPSNEETARARFYEGLSVKNFCLTEPAICKAYYADKEFGDERYPEVASLAAMLNIFSI